MYRFVSTMRELYDRLQDTESKDVFFARLQADLDRSDEALQKLGNLNSYNRLLWWQQKYALTEIDDNLDFDVFDAVRTVDAYKRDGKKVVIYGLGNWGKKIAASILLFGADFDGFVSRKPERFSEGFCLKPVYAPQWLTTDDAADVYVIIAMSNAYGSCDSIMDYLREIHFPKEQIIVCPHINRARSCKPTRKQYFEFPELYQKGTIFLDCGCLDGNSSIEFARFCNNQYSKMIAFEPDCANCISCENNLRKAGLHDVEIVTAAVSSEKGVIEFAAGQNGGSHVLSDYDIRVGVSGISVRTVAIDDIVGDEHVGFIKMDIEGSEYAALQGAERTIKRDKPLLAICVYHKPGDEIALMEYCHRLVPEYRFWLRYYTSEPNETVLYAAI